MASAERAVVEEFPEFSSGWVSEIRFDETDWPGARFECL
uniref:Uncharacterized protein n=1 Tax=Manihot esculenta TaxID=3983 RepID=A0A2C9UYC8_MANES